MNRTVLKETLPNGLKVLIYEKHNHPLVTFQIWVNVGSNNEQDEVAGVSHFIEHLWFQGTEKLGRKEFTSAFARLGGYINAFTHWENTAYLSFVPSEHFSKALEYMADAMMHPAFKQDEIDKERNVVIEEMKMYEDDPWRKTHKELLGLSFTKHYFKRDVIGFENVIANISRQEILNYYHNYYGPNNIAVVIVGDVDSKKALKEVEHQFSNWHSKMIDYNTSPQEPPQEELKSSTITGDIQQNYFGFCYHIPNALHQDRYAIDVFTTILCYGRSSRIYRNVREKTGLISNYHSHPFMGKEPGWWTLIACQDIDKNPESAQSAILAEIEKLKLELVSESEIERVKNYLESIYVYQQEHIFSIAYKLGSNEVLGNYEMAFEYPEKIRAVKPEDVKMVAQKYFSLSNCTILNYLPSKNASLSIETNALKSKIESGIKEIISSSKKGITKVKLNNGLTVLVKEDFSNPTISTVLALNIGSRWENESNNGISDMTIKMMRKATKNRTQDEISYQIESMGSLLFASAGEDISSLTLKSLARNFKPSIEILADIILNPTFPDDILQKEKLQQKALIAREKDDSDSYSLKLFFQSLFGSEDYGLPTIGEISSVDSLTNDALHKFHDSYYVPNNAVISIVGAINVDDVLKILESVFKEWKPKEIKYPKLREFKNPTGRFTKVESMDKKQTSIAIGFLAPKISDNERISFDFINSILGNSLDGRLHESLRELKGLAYSVSCSYIPFKDIGVFFGTIGTSPNQEEVAISGMLEEFKKLKDGHITDKDIENTKVLISGLNKMHREDPMNYASRYAVNELIGKGYMYVDEEDSFVQKTTLKNVQDTINKYFSLDNCALGIVRGKVE